MKLFATGIGHKTAPVELREQLAVKQSEIVDLAFVKKILRDPAWADQERAVA